MTVQLREVPSAAGASAYVTGRDLERGPLPVGAPGNLSHRRPHRPADLARDRAEVGAVTGCPPARWHLMHQVHGADVATVDASTPPGAELRGVDALVTTLDDRPLVVQAADCVPVLLGGPRAVGVAHAGRAGVAAGVVTRTLERLAALGQDPDELVVTIGPAIGGCCYEVPAALRDEVAAAAPSAAATTSWGTPALDLPAAVESELRAAGVGRVERLGICTREDERYFSHRRDPEAGRQVGLVVRRAA